MQSVSTDVYRERAREKFAVLLGPELAGQLEASLFQKSKDLALEDSIGFDSVMYKRLYVHKVRQVHDNLDPKSYIGNTCLLERLNTGQITVEALAEASPQELFPDNWQSLVDEKRRRDEIQYSSTAQAMTDKYTCRKCGSKKITYYDLQIRSADEGFTTFFTCLGCGAKWKKN